MSNPLICNLCSGQVVLTNPGKPKPIYACEECGYIED